jgi:hypothetical protein
MPTPEDFNSENYRICWPAILAVLAVQMTALVALSIAVANHSSFSTASLQDPGASLIIHDKYRGSKGSYKLSSARAGRCDLNVDGHGRGIMRSGLDPDPEGLVSAKW